MKKLCCDSDVAVCNELKTLLESHGIEATVKNVAADPVLGGEQTPLLSTLPELWVVRDDQFEQALALIDPPPLGNGHPDPPEEED